MIGNVEKQINIRFDSVNESTNSDDGYDVILTTLTSSGNKIRRCNTLLAGSIVTLGLGLALDRDPCPGGDSGDRGVLSSDKLILSSPENNGTVAI